MNDKTLQTLQNSNDPRELKNAALECARSSDAKDLEALRGFLTSADFLGRLDSAELYQTTIASLRLSRVMENLKENRAADAMLVQLTRSDVFLGEVLRMQLLIRALAPIRPSPPAAITYWDKFSQPGEPLAGDVVEALCVNQSAPAMELLQKKFTAPENAEVKTIWMQQMILPRRNDEPLLACCERLLLAGQPRDAQVEVVEALFDYQPEKWYRDCDPPKPPPLALASAASKEIYRRIADHALTKMKLPPELQLKVKATQELLKGKPKP